MDGKVKLALLSAAQAELEEIAQVHMVLSGPQSARKITDKIYAAMERLTLFPLSGPVIRDERLRAEGYRYILADSYLVIYRLLGDTILVYHIVHGKTDYPKLFHTQYF